MTVAAILSMTACDKNQSDNDNYLNKVTGSYSGNFSSQGTFKSAGTAVVTDEPDEQLQIHCYGDFMDTTFIMDAYEDGDSVMVCNTGEDFYNEYGHMGSGHNMMGMMSDDEENEWMMHLQQDHQPGDMHYGGFDMNHHTFDYHFKMMQGDSTVYVDFHGMRQ